jgi:maleamate amidohydrolase
MDTEKLVAELKQNYASIKASRMGTGNRPALLIVDFVEGFTNSSSPLAGSWDNEVNNTAELIEAARHKNLPVIFTTVEFTTSDLQSNLLYLKTPRIETLLQGSSWTEVDRRLPKLEQDIVISKKYGSAFFATSLAAQLQVLKIDTLLISGCVTSACVRASAVDAVQNGFRPIVIRETVGDRSILAHEANLMDIEQRYGDVISLQEALQYIQSN